MSKESGYNLKHNIKHSVCRWIYEDIELEKFLATLKSFGIGAIDLIGPSEWHILKKHDIFCSMCNGAEISLEEGWNNTNFHEELIQRYSEIIPKVADAGYTNLICFSGNRNGISDEQGILNCIEGFKTILPLAEKHNVVLQLELFNQYDHPDYMADTSKWGIDLCKKLNSENFKLLFDIYHMQIQEGNIIQSIKTNGKYFGHYHVAGVPGRNEPDDSQELNYPAIIKAIYNSGFTGYVAQEFLPISKDRIASLSDAFRICDL